MMFRRFCWNSNPPHVPFDKKAIAVIEQVPDRLIGRVPDRQVIRFGWRANPMRWPRHIDRTDFFGPQIIFRHKGEFPKRTQAPHLPNNPAGLFHHLAVKRVNGRFPRIHPATRQLQLKMGIALIGEQKLPVARQNRVDARASTICDVGSRRVAKSSDHSCPPWRLSCPAYIDAICQEPALKETP
jgi:hypothetical protein